METGTIRYLAIIGDKVLQFDAYAEGKAFIKQYRGKALAILQTQMVKGGEWQDVAKTVWQYGE